jgi:8-oxo-dGTP pyrophosphatase MutT (NUDIX family)
MILSDLEGLRDNRVMPEDSPVTLDEVKAALSLDPFDEEAAREIMAARPRPSRPTQPWRDGAVLVLLYPGDDGLTLALTRRTDTVEHHRRQLALPGGAREDGEELVETALRETEEEIGVPAARVEVLGRMTPLRIPPSAFVVHPFVGHVPSRPEFHPDPREVAGVIEVPLDLLLDEEGRGEQEKTFRGETVLVPYFRVPDVPPPPLWGATAMMLSGLVERLRAARDRG